jgi:hypothetical protein
MTTGKKQTESASPFAVSFIVGTLCYSLRSFSHHPLSGIAAFLIGSLGAFATVYVYQFGLLYVRQRQAAGQTMKVLHDSAEFEPEIEKGNTDARKS